MQIRHLTLRGFKGLDVSLDWAPAVVLFGRNDAGKTNMLEAIELALGGLQPARVDPLAGASDGLSHELAVELETDDEEHWDRWFELLRFLVWDRTWPWLVSPSEADVRPTEPWGVMDERRHFLVERPDRGSTSSPEDLDELIEVRPVEPRTSEALALLRSRLVDRASSRTDAWAERRHDFEVLLDACLACHVLRTGEDATATWMFDPARVSERDRAAASRLMASRPHWAGGEVTVLDHDRKMIEQFYGHELAPRCINVLPIRGALKVRSLLDAEFLTTFDVPLVILLDNVKVSVVHGSEEPSGTEREAREVWRLLRNWDDRKRRPHVIPFELPDIWCALPEPCVRMVVDERGGCDFPGRDPLVEAFRAARGGEQIDFKSFFTRRVGLGKDCEKDPFAG